VGAIKVKDNSWTVSFGGAPQTQNLQPYSGSTKTTYECG
jgi:hypothetical protein